MVSRHGGFADRLRVQWTWARPLPDALDLAKAGPLFCGGITVFSPLLLHNLSSTGRVGIIGIGGLCHIAFSFTHKRGCGVHAFTTSDTTESEAHTIRSHQSSHNKSGREQKKNCP